MNWLVDNDVLLILEMVYLLGLRLIVFCVFFFWVVGWCGYYFVSYLYDYGFGWMLVDIFNKDG